MKRSSVRLISVAAMVLTAMFVLTRAAPAQSYTFTTLDDPAGAVGQTYACRINRSGNIVGYYEDSNGNTHGFLYNGTTHTYKTIDDPKGTDTWAEGINDSGNIVGEYKDGSGNHGFLYSGGVFTTLDAPGGTRGTEATDINDSGEIVGWYIDGSNAAHGFVYSDGVFTQRDDPSSVGTTSFYGINNSGDIVGLSRNSSGLWLGFLYNGTTYTALDDPKGVDGTFAFGINDSGDIVGEYNDKNNLNHGFLYNGGVFTTVDAPGGVGNTKAIGINDSGDIVGYYQDNSGGNHGFLATAQSLWQNAASTGAGWYYLNWFGLFNTNSSPWIYHQTLGWLYPYGSSTSSIWFWDPQWDGHGGWWWTSASVYPWIYSHPDGGWLYFDAAASTPSARWFYNSLTGWDVH